MTNIESKRKQLVSSSMSDIRRIVSEEGVNRPALDKVRQVLVSMAGHPDLFSETDYPSPTAEQKGKIYLLSEEPKESYSLYLVSTLPPGRSPVHDHNTWAVIAGIGGEEENTIYRRLDDGSKAGRASVEEDHKVVLGEGDGIAFMPEDIHRVCNVGSGPTRHFHLYGKGFNQQGGRVSFNLKDGTTAPIPSGMLPIDESRRVL